MDSDSEPLEQIFRKFERPSEKLVAGSSSVAPPMDAENRQEGSSKRKEKERRRTSVSISRFGQVPGHDSPSNQNLGSDSPSPTPMTPIASKSIFYQSQIRNRSTNSLDSNGSEGAEGSQTEDEHHVTQIQKIVGRRTISKAVGGMLPRRRLSRSHSANMLDVPGHTKLVIDVSIEESQDDHPDPEELGTSRSKVFTAGGGAHTSVRTPDAAPRTNVVQNRWTRMKGFAQKLRRNRSLSESVISKDKRPEGRVS